MSQKNLVLCVSALLFVFPFAAKAQTSAAPSKSELRSKLDTYLTRNEIFGMSAAVRVAKDGEVVLEKGYGQANYATRSKLTDETPFIIGSPSKQFTEEPILKLETEG